VRTSSGAGTTPQGGVISPLLANIYLHEVLDTWLEQDVRPRLRGSASWVRYADDAVMLFEHEDDARRVMQVFPKRFGRYGLTLHPDKTRLVPFHGRVERKCRKEVGSPRTNRAVYALSINENALGMCVRDPLQDQARRPLRYHPAHRFSPAAFAEKGKSAPTIPAHMRADLGEVDTSVGEASVAVRIRAREFLSAHSSRESSVRAPLPERRSVRMRDSSTKSSRGPRSRER